MTALEMSEALIRRLMADLRADLEMCEEIAARLGTTCGPLEDSLADVGARALVALELHRYYTALEGAFERVARYLDGHVPTREGWHRELLRQVSLPLPGVREALVPQEVAAELSHLLSFRLFFRHAYAVELDWSRLIEHRERARRLHPEVKVGLGRLIEHLESTLDVLDGRPLQ